MKKDLLVTILFGKFQRGRQLYRIEEDLIFVGWTHEVGVYKGFISDLASLPLLLRLLASPTGRWAHAAIVHDMLYRTHYLPRIAADQIFFKIMKDFEVPIWKAKGAYYIVRTFGNIIYTKNKKEIEKHRKYGYVANITPRYTV